MIVEFFVGLFFGIIEFLLGLLPPWTPFDLTGVAGPIASGAGVFFGLVNWADQYAPVKMLLSCITLFITLWAAAHVYRATIWVLSKLHILGGGSS